MNNFDILYMRSRYACHYEMYHIFRDIVDIKDEYLSSKNKGREIHKSFCGNYLSYEWKNQDVYPPVMQYYEVIPDNSRICKNCIRFRGKLKPVQLSLLEEF